VRSVAGDVWADGEGAEEGDGGADAAGGVDGRSLGVVEAGAGLDGGAAPAVIRNWLGAELVL
jgi:hypothetical protein